MNVILVIYLYGVVSDRLGRLDVAVGPADHAVQSNADYDHVVSAGEPRGRREEPDVGGTVVTDLRGKVRSQSARVSKWQHLQHFCHFLILTHLSTVETYAGACVQRLHEAHAPA